MERKPIHNSQETAVEVESKQKIPIENRIFHLRSRGIEISRMELTLRAIVRRVGCPTQWAIEKVDDFDILPSTPGYERVDGLDRYPGYTEQILSSEWEWEQEYFSLPDIISFGKLVTITQKSRNWVQDQIQKENIKPRKETGVKINKKSYDKRVAKILHDINLATPVGYNIFSMANRLNRDWDWVNTRIRDNDKTSSETVTGLTGRSEIIYSQATFDRLKKEKEAEDKAKSLLTIKQLARAVGHDRKWVSKRLPFINVVPNYLPGKGGFDYPHYPKSTIDKLQKLPKGILAEIAVKKTVTDPNKTCVDLHHQH